MVTIAEAFDTLNVTGELPGYTLATGELPRKSDRAELSRIQLWYGIDNVFLPDDPTKRVGFRSPISRETYETGAFFTSHRVAQTGNWRGNPAEAWKIDLELCPDGLTGDVYSQRTGFSYTIGRSYRPKRVDPEEVPDAIMTEGVKKTFGKSFSNARRFLRENPGRQDAHVIIKTIPIEHANTLPGVPALEVSAIYPVEPTTPGTIEEASEFVRRLDGRVQTGIKNLVELLERDVD